MRRKGPPGLQGNEQYEGFCVDMLRELADILRFSFRIKLVDDGLYGAPEPNGSWNGMVGELINRVSPGGGSTGGGPGGGSTGGGPGGGSTGGVPRWGWRVYRGSPTVGGGGWVYRGPYRPATPPWV